MIHDSFDLSEQLSCQLYLESTCSILVPQILSFGQHFGMRNVR
jgi:hypothetical protein